MRASKTLPPWLQRCSTDKARCLKSIWTVIKWWLLTLMQASKRGRVSRLTKPWKMAGPATDAVSAMGTTVQLFLNSKASSCTSPPPLDNVKAASPRLRLPFHPQLQGGLPRNSRTKPATSSLGQAPPRSLCRASKRCSPSNKSRKKTKTFRTL
jgi:hypothetical protein